MVHCNIIIVSNAGIRLLPFTMYDDTGIQRGRYEENQLIDTAIQLW